MTHTAQVTSEDRPGGLPAADDVLVSGRERDRRRPGRAPAVALVGVLALVAVVAVRSHRDVGAGPLPSTPTPSRTAAAPTSAPPRSTDLATVVSVGRVGVPGVAVDEQVRRVTQALQGSSVVASYRYLPAAGGVQVRFDRRLDEASAAAFRAALSGLSGAAVDLDDAPGTTVDVSVPAAAGYTCVPEFFQPQAVLSGPDLDAVAHTLGIFGLGFAAGTVTVSYTGPQVSRADLLAVGAALAHSCGTSPDTVTLFRHRDTG